MLLFEGCVFQGVVYFGGTYCLFVVHSVGGNMYIDVRRWACLLKQQTLITVYVADQGNRLPSFIFCLQKTNGSVPDTASRTSEDECKWY
jgi:hypothetical protein